MTEMSLENVLYLENFECVDAEVLVESSSPPPSASVSAHPLLMSARLAHPTQGTPSPEGLATRDLIVIPSAPTALQLHHAIHQYYCPSCEPPPGRLITLALRGSQCTVENVREELLVSDAVVEVRAEDSSGQSSPSAADQHHYITVQEREGVGMGRSGGDERDLEGSPGVVETTARRMEPRYRGYYSVPPLCENGVGYHVQYVESQEIYSQPHHTHMDPLRTYPVYTSSAVPAGVDATEAAWVNAGGGGGGGGAGGADTFAYGAVVATDEARSAPDPPRAAAASPSAHRTPPATLTWLIDNYETAEGVSLPRSTLYAHYLRHCTAHDLEPVNAASFGKLIRSVFLGLRTRRLGTRGNSKYHYYGIRAKLNAAGVVNDDVGDGDTQDSDTDDKGTVPRHRQSAEARGGASGSGGSSSGEDPAHRQGLAAPVPPELPALELTPPLPSDISDTEVELFRRHYVEHSSGFLDAVTSLELTNVERTRREFWRRVAHEDDNSNCALSRRALHRLISRKDVASWLRSADLALYQRAVELLLPDVLRPIASSLTQSIRNFAKTLESAVASATAGLPTAAVRACADAASALAAALRRYTSLNHLAQAARAVLHNSHQIHQMLTDLNRVDFRVVREQAAWACACGKSAAAHDLETDFKATLGRGATLEQWASWLERAVRTALGSSERRVDYSARARRFLLHWSFYSSLVIRELTLRSAASFGSFHLIRLLYDEYVAYLVEQRVADHEGTPPIAVMHRASEEEEEEEEEEGEEEEWEWVEGDAEGEDEDMPADKKLKTE